MLILNTLLVGLGNIGLNYDYSNKNITTHAKALSLSKNIRFLFAIDKNYKQRKKFEKKYQINTYSKLPSLEKLNEINFVIISVNTENHLNVVKEIIKLKNLKIILIEKPCGKNLKEYLQIKNLCKKNNIRLLINYHRIFDKNFLKIKKIFQKLKNFKGIANYSRGLSNNASHILSLLVFSNMVPLNLQIIKKKNNPDFILYFKKGFLVFLGDMNKNVSNNELEIIGHNIKIKSSKELNEFNIYNLKKNFEFKDSYSYKKMSTVRLNYRLSQKIVMDNIIKDITNNKKNFFLKKFDDIAFLMNKIKLSN